ncbi:hypothetical protein, conserved [Eimeria maxima]|uniref:Uncharacterized protein n=1 Tax=Eimeria maxima TaxID=5804 RepID=U6M5K2_EIMMA|nr:hypothetical protein, conserved [Eimeria maxima]CDJ59507.1 hypothetical protein, conserved [Eimeria maxima]
MQQKKFREQIVNGVRLVMQVREAEEKEMGYANVPTEDNFFGEFEATRALHTSIEGAGCGLFKRVLRIRKHIFLRSREGLRFGWGDRLSLPSTASTEVGAEYEEAMGIVENALNNYVPSLSSTLTKLIKEKRIQRRLINPNQYNTDQYNNSLSSLDYCPYEPSPLGIPLLGDSFISPLTGTFLSFTYTPDVGAAGLAQFVWRNLMQTKLQELNPLMASFISPSPPSSSSSPSLGSSSSSSSRSRSPSVLARNNSLLVEAFALWGRHVAFIEDLNSVFNPQQQLRLLISYLDETIGRVVKGSLRRSFAKRMKAWANTSKPLEELEKAWLRSFKDHFGPEGDVFDTYAGVRSQWLFSDVFEELMNLDSSTTAEGNNLVISSPFSSSLSSLASFSSSPSSSSSPSPPKPVYIMAFMGLLKVFNDCYFIKGYRKTDKQRKPTQEAISKAFNNFVAEAEKEGFIRALANRGAAVHTPRFWTDAMHETVDKPILEAEMLAQELSYFLTHKVKGAA